MKTLVMCGVLGLGLLLALTSASAKTYVMPEKDVHFVKTVGQGGRGELKIAELGVQKATGEAVKEFAGLLVKDQTLINQELKTLAELKGIPISLELAPEMAESLKALEKKRTKEFDKAFLEEIRKWNDKDLKLLEAALKETGDPEIKAFIDKVLPLLRTHAEMLKKL